MSKEFRAWDMESKFMVDWEEIQKGWEYESYSNSIFNEDHYKCMQLVKEDKSGKIFEDDKVKVVYMDNGIEYAEEFTVKYNEESCSYSPFDWEYNCDGCCCGTEILSVEVIGNIYEGEI